MKAIVYDLEILRAIPDKKEPIVPGILYCNGWGDHAGMGISVLGCYNYDTDEYRVFCRDNIQEFLSLVQETDYVVGFNSARFDRKVVLAALDCHTTHADEFFRKDYDILAEAWVSEGLDPDKFYWKTHGGYGLEAMANANGLSNKRMSGALAPIAWQQGEIGRVIDYCLDDVIKTKKLFDRIMRDGTLHNPKNPGTLLNFRRPWLGETWK